MDFRFCNNQHTGFNRKVFANANNSNQNYTNNTNFYSNNNNNQNNNNIQNNKYNNNYNIKPQWGNAPEFNMSNNSQINFNKPSAKSIWEKKSDNCVNNNSNISVDSNYNNNQVQNSTIFF